jgi:hypothetical protein
MLAFASIRTTDLSKETTMTAEISWLIVLLLLAMGICAARQHRHQLLTPSGAISALPQRHLHPHTPDHCPSAASR